jgi:N-methylhydantoinase B/oxoprolinase/acetone carboxylase alpha subunit
MGDPAKREPQRVEADVASGLVSAEGAARDYPARKQT